MEFLFSGYFTYCVSFLVVYMSLTTVLHMQFYTTGIVNFGIVGFWGIAMYLCAIFVVTFGMPFALAVAAAVGITMLISLLLGRIILNLDGQAVLVATLAFSTIIELFVITAKDLTNGVIGFGTVKMPFDFGKNTDFAYMLLLIGCLAALMFYAYKIKKAPYGRLLLGIKDNEPLAQGLGKPTFKHKVIFFTITCGFIAFFGAMTTPLYSYLFPRMITSPVTFTVWIALLLGAQSKIRGGVVGVLATVLVFDYLLQGLVVSSEYSQILPNIKYFVFGLTLVLILIFRPAGILGANKKEAGR